MRTTTAVILLSALTKAQPFALLSESNDLLENKDIVTNAPFDVSLDKIKDNVKSFEPTHNKTASPNSRGYGYGLGYVYGRPGYGNGRPGYGPSYGYYGRKRSAEAEHSSYGSDKREAVNTKMIQKIMNRGHHGPKSRIEDKLFLAIPSMYKE